MPFIASYSRNNSFSLLESLSGLKIVTQLAVPEKRPCLHLLSMTITEEGTDDVYRFFFLIFKLIHFLILRKAALLNVCSFIIIQLILHGFMVLEVSSSTVFNKVLVPFESLLFWQEVYVLWWASNLLTAVSWWEGDGTSEHAHRHHYLKQISASIMHMLYTSIPAMSRTPRGLQQGREIHTRKYRFTSEE